MSPIIDDFPDPPPAPTAPPPEPPPAPLYICRPAPADTGPACEQCGFAYGPGHKTIYQRTGGGKG